MDYLHLDQLRLSILRPDGAPVPKPSAAQLRLAQQTGFVPPLLVRPIHLDHEIIMGASWWIAAQTVPIDPLPCLIKEIDDEAARGFLAMDQTGSKEEVDSIEDARHLQYLLDNGNFGSVAALARTLGITRGALHHRLRLLRLSEPVQELVSRRKLSPLHVRTLVPLPESIQLNLARTMVRERLSGHDATVLVRLFRSLWNESLDAASVKKTISEALNQLGQERCTLASTPAASIVPGTTTAKDDEALLEVLREHRARESANSNVNLAKIQADLTARIGYMCQIQQLPTGAGEIAFRYHDQGAEHFLEEVLREHLDENTILHQSSHRNGGWWILLFHSNEEFDRWFSKLLPPEDPWGDDW